MTNLDASVVRRRATLVIVGILCIGAIWLDFVQPAENEYQLYSFTFALPTADISATNLDWVLESVIPVADEPRAVLFAHPDAAITYRDLSIPKGARLKAAFGINQDAWDRGGDGTEFSVDLTYDGGTRIRLFEQYIDPKNNPADRHWFDLDVDLDQWEGQRVALTWNTDGGPQGNGSDWAGWSNPRIVQVEPSPPWLIPTLIKVVVSLPLLAFAPGYLLMTRFGPVERLRFGEALYLVIAISLMITSVFALALAQVGLFSLWALLLCQGAATLILYSVAPGRARRTLPHRRWRRRTLPPILLFAIAAVLFFRPSERLIGGQDPGVYLSAGVNLARTGSLLIYDPILSPIHDTEYAEVVTAPAGFYGNRAGILTPHGVHLQPTWIAILYSMGELRLALVTNAIFGWLGVVAVYLIGRRLWGEGVGLAAGLLLSTDISEIWFARWYVAEMLVQFLFFSGLFAMLAWQDKQRSRTGSMLLASTTAASMGLIHLAKLDSFLLLLVVVLWSVWQWYRGPWRSDHWAFVATYLGLIGYTVLHAAVFSSEYVRSLFSFYVQFLEWRRTPMALLVAAILSMTFLLLTRRPGHWIAVKVESLQKPVLWLLTVLIAGGAVYGFFIRPGRIHWEDSEWTFVHQWATEPDGLLGSRPDESNFERSFIEESLVRLGWYVTPLGFFLGSAGLIGLLWSRERNRTFLLWGGGLAQTAFFASRGTIFPQHFWAIRRHVQVIIPAIMLLISFFLLRVVAGGPPRFVRAQSSWRLISRILAISILIGLIVSYWSTANDYVLATDFDGGIQQLNELARMLPQDAVVIIGDEVTAHPVGTPLSFIFDRRIVIPKRRATTDISEELAALVRMWRSDGSAVFWLTTIRGRQVAPSFPYESIPVASYSMSIEALATKVDGLPTEIVPFSPTFYLYELQPAAGGRGPRTYDLSTAVDEPLLIDGLSGFETCSPGVFRWMNGDALVSLASPLRAERRTVSFAVFPTRPDGFPDPWGLAVYAYGQSLGAAVFGTDAKAGELPITVVLTRALDATDCESVPDKWVPGDWNNSTGEQESGAQIDSVAVRQHVSPYRSVFMS